MKVEECIFTHTLICRGEYVMLWNEHNLVLKHMKKNYIYIVQTGPPRATYNEQPYT